MKKRHISTRNIAVAATVRRPQRRAPKRAAAILARRYEKHTPVSRGLLGEARMSSSASGSTTQSVWMSSGVRGAASREDCESTK